MLLAKGERVGLLTDGEELRLLALRPGASRQPRRPSASTARADGGRAHEIPDSFRLLAGPRLARKGSPRSPELTDEARLTQTGSPPSCASRPAAPSSRFVQEVLDHPANRERLAPHDGPPGPRARPLARGPRPRLPPALRPEARGLAGPGARLQLRLDEPLAEHLLAQHGPGAVTPARCSTSGAETGGLLESGLRTLFRLFSEGLAVERAATSSRSAAMLFGARARAVLDRLVWGERAVAQLLDRLLWTPAAGKIERQRVHYGAARRRGPRPRLRGAARAGARHRDGAHVPPAAPEARSRRARWRRAKLPARRPERGRVEDERRRRGRGRRATKTRPTGRRPRSSGSRRSRPAASTCASGLGRKSTGSYYTPHPFVRFLVQETLGPQVAERSPEGRPAARRRS